MTSSLDRLKGGGKGPQMNEDREAPPPPHTHITNPKKRMTQKILLGAVRTVCSDGGSLQQRIGREEREKAPFLPSFPSAIYPNYIALEASLGLGRRRRGGLGGIGRGECSVSPPCLEQRSPLLEGTGRRGKATPSFAQQAKGEAGK